MRVRGFEGRPARISLVAAVVLLVSAIPLAAEAAPPPNDAFAARTTIASVPYTAGQSTAEATTEPGEPSPRCGPMGKTIWYQFTPGSDVVLAATMAGSDFDTLLAVWTGPSLGSLTEVGCADFGSVVFAAEAATTYLIQAGGWIDSSGSATVRLRETEAGVISGTVTEDGTGTPLASICVDVVDADFLSFTTVVTDGAGAYRAPVRPGIYVVVFYDWCDPRNDHQTEVYNNKLLFTLGDEVSVSGSTEVSGVNAGLALSCPFYGDFPHPQFVGTEGPDAFTGTDEPEVFCGFGGADRMIGSGGRDRIIGGSGGDRISGGAGSDYLWGGQGSDRVTGGPDNDFVRGNGGDDRLGGGPGRDLCDGGEGDDRAAKSCERTDDIP